MSQEKSVERQDRVREKVDAAEEVVVDVFGPAAKQAARRLVELAMQKKNSAVAFRAAKRIVDDVRPPAQPKGITINNAPTFVSNLGLPPAPAHEAVTVTLARKKIAPAPAKKAVILPEAADRPDFGVTAPADKFLPRSSADMTKIAAPTPERPQTQIVDFPTAIKPRQVPIPDDLKAE